MASSRLSGFHTVAAVRSFIKVATCSVQRDAIILLLPKHCGGVPAAKGGGAEHHQSLQ
jgi:hypothetical protein